jgi:ABC-type lipoprotein release transport system permease subunit
MLLFLAKSLVIGVSGGIAGLAAGIAAGEVFVKMLDHTAPMISSVSVMLNIPLAVYALAGAAAISLLAGWVPALKAVYTDPARILSRE